MTELPDRVLVPAGSPSNTKHIHTDPDCHNLNGVDVVEKDSSVVGERYPVCSDCAGQSTVVKVKDTHATRRRLEELSPDDLGLSAIGERRGQA